MIRLCSIAVLATFGATFSGCTGDVTPEPTSSAPTAPAPTPTAPMSSTEIIVASGRVIPPGASPELVHGQMLLVNGCVALRVDGEDRLLIFPLGASLTDDGTGIYLGDGTLPLDAQLTESRGWERAIADLEKLEGTLNNVEQCRSVSDRAIVLSKIEDIPLPE